MPLSLIDQCKCALLHERHTVSYALQILFQYMARRSPITVEHLLKASGPSQEGADGHAEAGE